MAEWADINSLLKTYQSDLTAKATNLKNFYSQIQPPSSGIGAVNASGTGLGAPINWTDITNQDNQSVQNRGGPSAISRVLDIISRPGYTISEGARQAAIEDPNDPNRFDNIMSGMWQGFTGKKKTRMSKFLDEMEYNSNKRSLDNPDYAAYRDDILNKSRFTDILKNPNYNPQDYKTPDKGEGSWFQAVSGLGLDIATDPLNIIGGPIIRGVAKGTGAAYRGITGTQKLDIPAPIPYQAPNARPLNAASHPINATPAPVPNQFFVSEEVNPVIAAFSTAYKNKNLRPEVMQAQQGAKARAVTRATSLNNIARNFTPAQQQQAFTIGQSRVVPTGNADIDNLGIELEKSIRDLMNNSDMRQYAQLANQGIKGSKQGLIDDINEQLRIHGEKFQFSTKVEDHFRNNAKVDLSNHTRWMDAWRYHKFDDPLAFASKLSHAVENVTAKYQFLDDFAERFGSVTRNPNPTTQAAGLPKGTRGLTHAAGIRNQRLQGLYFDPVIAKEMNHVLKNWDQIAHPKSKFIKLADETTSLWKTGVTIYAPSHHIRNMIGDTYFSWMDGVNTIKPYTIAARAIQSQRGRYGDLTEIGNVTSKSALANAMSNPGSVALTTKGGIPFTYEQLYTAAYTRGLLQSANTIEDVTDRIIDLKNLSNPVLRRIANPAGGHVSKAVRTATELREHYVKLAHFADALKKSKATSFDEAANQASKRVRKWHPDGLDLTDIERNYFRRVIPFYSWIRKSIPLVVESTVMNPGKALMYPRFMQMIQDATGTSGNSISDPFPEDQLFPDWIKEKGIGPIGYHGIGGVPGVLDNFARSGTNQQGENRGYNVVNPSNPLIDTVAQYAGMGRATDPIQGLMSSINPLLRVPAEIGTGTTALGTPVSYDPAGYATQQIPIAAYLAQLGNVTPFGATARGEKEGIPNWEGIMNYLTALGIRGTGASIKQAEFEAKERAKSGQGG